MLGGHGHVKVGVAAPEVIAADVEALLLLVHDGRGVDDGAVEFAVEEGAEFGADGGLGQGAQLLEGGVGVGG